MNEHLHEYLQELAQRALLPVDPIPPASNSSPCALGGAQDITESAGSPYLADWALDVRETYRLTDAELVDKMRWELEALKKRERLQRVLEVPTIYPEAK
jgi:hypothetical protein